MNFSVTQNGKPLDRSLYHWDEVIRTFTTEEAHLVLDFSEMSGVTFKTSENCTFKTGNECTFITGGNCNFKTGYGCTFNTGDHCIFNTGNDCIFNTGTSCTFNIYEGYKKLEAGGNSIAIIRDDIGGLIGVVDLSKSEKPTKTEKTVSKTFAEQFKEL